MWTELGKKKNKQVSQEKEKEKVKSTSDWKEGEEKEMEKRKENSLCFRGNRDKTWEWQDGRPRKEGEIQSDQKRKV